MITCIKAHWDTIGILITLLMAFDYFIIYNLKMLSHMCISIHQLNKQSGLQLTLMEATQSET